MLVCQAAVVLWTLYASSGCPVPPGDHNCAKGKAGYPTLAFQCITDYNCRIIGIYGPQFGARNNKEIVKVDPNVHRIRHGWYKDVSWKYYTYDGRVKKERDVYLICDNGFIAGQIRFPPTQMQIVLHLRGTSKRTSKASERTWSSLLAF
jgi:hypothetical protein